MSEAKLFFWNRSVRAKKKQYFLYREKACGRAWFFRGKKILAFFYTPARLKSSSTYRDTFARRSQLTYTTESFFCSSPLRARLIKKPGCFSMPNGRKSYLLRFFGREKARFVWGRSFFPPEERRRKPARAPGAERKPRGSLWTPGDGGI